MTQDNTMNPVIKAIAYVNQFRGNTFLIKLGGSILHDEQLIESLCFDLKLLKEAGINIIIVHGGSKAINHYLSNNHIESDFIDGLRVTSSTAMQAIEMVLCGQVNKVLVRKLNSIDIKAVGLSGSDNNMLLCDYYSEQHGYVGVINSVNTEVITHLMSQPSTSLDVIPVIAPIGVDTAGHPMNINADYAASHIAIALQVDKLIYLTDQDGIYDIEGKRYSELSRDNLIKLITDKTVTGGMLTKTKAISSALNSKLNHVHILNGSKHHVLLEELFTMRGVGTLCNDTRSICNQAEVEA